MGSLPLWAKIGLPVLAFLLVCWLLIWLLTAFVMLVVKILVGLVVVVGLVALAKVALKR
jgi:hypothetical protein